MQQILIDGQWIESQSAGSFQAVNPVTEQLVSEHYPVSSWSDLDAALGSAQRAFAAVRTMPRHHFATFLEAYANQIDAQAQSICELANIETGLPVSPRLLDVELPRTSNQLRQAAAAAREATWCRPTIDTKTGIRSVHAAIGPVGVFGPNNFPLAFGSISGGDFAAAVAAGNPVIAKANSSHPGTTRLFAQAAQRAAEETAMPKGFVQLIYRMSHDDGERFVADPRLAAIGYTGSRHAGLKLKAAADAVGKPIYLELSSVNPVVVLPNAISERGQEIAKELCGSCLLGTGQFCTSPGIVILLADKNSSQFIEWLRDQTQAAAPGVLLSESVLDSLKDSVAKLRNEGAEVLCGAELVDEAGFRFANTLLKVDGKRFLSAPTAFQTEAFGNASLIVVADSVEQARDIVSSLEGNLTGCLYSHSSGDDDDAYDLIEPELRQRVGRLLNDKMPTGVAVSPAMNHGGPFPATGHPGFTAVGMPDSILRFSMLQCYDNVRQHRLPEILKDENSTGSVRRVDGDWTDQSIAPQAELSKA